MGNGILGHEASGSPTEASEPKSEDARGNATALDERQQLVRAGVAEMTQDSSVDPRVSDIVRRAGLSNKAFYRHFRSKEDLLFAVLVEQMRIEAQQFEDRLETETKPLERVRGWIWGVLELALDPDLSASHRPLLVRQGRLLDNLGAEVWGHVARVMSILQQAIADARDAGDVPETVEPDQDAEAIFHLVMGWMQGRVVGRVTPTREEAERVVAFALRGLGGRGA